MQKFPIRMIPMELIKSTNNSEKGTKFDYKLARIERFH